MKIWNTFLVLSMLAGGLAGCASVTITEGAAGEVSGQAAIVATFCTGERWIGLTSKDTPTCPVVANWKTSNLFDLGEASASLEDLARAAGLDRYCLFTPPGEMDAGEKWAGPSVRGLERIDRDCRGVQVTAVQGAYGQKTAPALAELTRTVIASPPPGRVRGTVRLTLLDTQPGVELPIMGKELCSKHGYNLGLLAQQVAGAPGSGVEVHHRLALGAKGAAAATTCVGGTQGFISEIGVALLDELVAWEAEPHPRDHLVVNLSLGWDGELFGGLQSSAQMPVPAQSVYRALEVAQRAKVAVFAAAGNRVADPMAYRGPLLPAGWETRNKRKPLVFAVSGLTSTGQPLPNLRPGALAPRASFGGPAVVELSGGNYTSALTGSSVGTAVVSAFAAATWARHPVDSPVKLVKRLQNEAREIPSQADEALAKKRPNLRHIAPGKLGQPAVAPWATEVVLTLTPLASESFVPLHSSDGFAEANPQPGHDPCPNCGVDPPGSSAEGTLTVSIELAEDWDWHWDSGAERVCVVLEAAELTWGQEVRTYQTQAPEEGEKPCWSGKGATYRVTLTLGTTAPPVSALTGGLLFWTVQRKDQGQNGVSTSALSSLFLAKEPE